jgi:hypothetical protein
MKKFFLASIFFIMLLTISTKKNQAQCNVCKQSKILDFTCYDKEGNVAGYGMACIPGTTICKTIMCDQVNN